MKRIALLGTLCAVLVPGVASADRMSYSFVQVQGTFAASVDDPQTTLGGSVEGSGLGVAGGWIMGPYAFVDGRYDSYDLDGGIEGNEFSARLGFRNRFQTITPWRLDGYGAISFENRSFDRGAVTVFDESGVGLTAGLRVSPIEEFEAGAELGYANMGGFDGFLAQAGIQWNITRFFAANLAYRYEDYVGKGPDVDLDGVRFGLRIQFGGG